MANDNFWCIFLFLLLFAFRTELLLFASIQYSIDIFGTNTHTQNEGINHNQCHDARKKETKPREIRKKNTENRKTWRKLNERITRQKSKIVSVFFGKNNTYFLVYPCRLRCPSLDWYWIWTNYTDTDMWHNCYRRWTICNDSWFHRKILP